MKRRIVGLLTLAASLTPVLSGAGHAWFPRLDLTLTSDYILRGYSQSANDPVLQFGVTARHRSGFVGGLWGSGVEFDRDDRVENPRRLEIRGFAGYVRPVGQSWVINGMVVRYQYPRADPLADASSSEISASVAWRDALSFTLAYSPDVFGSDRSGLLSELSGRVSIAGAIDLSGGIGYADLQLPGVSDYSYGHAGIGRSFGRFSIEAGYYYSDADPIPRWGEVVEGRWVATLSTGFP